MNSTCCASARADLPSPARSLRSGRLGVLTTWPVLLCAPAAQAAFDLRHEARDAVLKQQVVVAPGGMASGVRCAAIEARPEALCSACPSCMRMRMRVWVRVRVRGQLGRLQALLATPMP